MLRCIFMLRSISSSCNAEPLGRVTPRSKSRSDSPLTKEQLAAKTRCR